MATDFNVLRSQKMPDAIGQLTNQAQGFQKIQANDTAEKMNQLKIQAHKLDVLKELSGGVKDDAGLQRAKKFARSMGITDDILGQIPDDYVSAKPVLDNFYAGSDAAKTQLANQYKALDMQYKGAQLGLQTQKLQNEINPQPQPIVFPGQGQQGLNPVQNQEFAALTGRLNGNVPVTGAQENKGDYYDTWRGGLDGAAKDAATQQAQPTMYSVGKTIFDVSGGQPKVVNGKQAATPADIQVANMLSDPNVPEATKENLRFAIRQTAGQAGDIAKNKEIGKEQGIQKASLTSQLATYPTLQKVVQKLRNLSETATYTKAGKIYNAAGRQLGADLPQGATDRAAYIATIDNEILPLLRQTFGAQFTENEGKSLKVTLGDPDKSPQEKQAVLDAFLEAKLNNIDSTAGKTGDSADVSLANKAVEGFKNNQPSIQASIINPKTGERMILKDGAWVKP